MAEFAYKLDQWCMCYFPLKGYYGKTVNPLTGKRPIVFDVVKSFSGVPLELPCGKCVGCRLEAARQWALRIVHEKRMHEDSAFLTLTYNDKCIPTHGSLALRDLQLFMKRLRKQRPCGLRFFGCGEYGEITRRPHYHVLLLNTSFADLEFRKMSGDYPLFVSKELTGLWTKGDSFVGEVTFESAAYVARYCTKKILGSGADAHYGAREREFTCMSRRPGIGFTWFEKFYGEAYAHDSAISNSREVKLPRYYDTKFDAIDSDKLEVLKVRRRRTAMTRRADNTPQRRAVRARVAELNLARLSREV